MRHHRRGAVLVGVLVGVAAIGVRIAQADIVLSSALVQTGAACSPVCAPGDVEWTYLAGVSQNERVSSAGAVPTAAPDAAGPSNTFEDFFTLYDFVGYIPGSETHPVGWAFEGALVGSTPTDVLASDAPLIPNLTWCYTGAADLIGPQLLGLFSARTTATGQTDGAYAASATNFGSAFGAQDNKLSRTITPLAEIPEPTTLLLLGSGLLTMCTALGRQLRRTRPR